MERDTCSGENDEKDKFILAKSFRSAVRGGNIDYVKRITPKVFLDDKSIYKLVNDSIHRNLVDMVEYLVSLSHNMNLNYLDENGCSLLYWTIAKANKDMLQCLVEKNVVNVNFRNKSYKSPLHYAVDLKWLREHAVKDIEADAVLDFSNFCCNLLLKMGADVNLGDKEGYTPLHVAVRVGNNKGVEMLLKYGDSSTSQSKQGSPLHIAVRKQNIPIIHLLLNHSKSYLSCVDFEFNTPLHLAMALKYNDVIDVLLSFVNRDCLSIGNYCGDTVLHLAAKNFDYELVKKLLDLGADVNSRSILGDTPLTRTISCKKSDHPNCDLCLTVSELLRRGANVNFKLKSNLTALHIAIYNKHYCIMETLLNSSVVDSVLSSVLFNVLNFCRMDFSLDLLVHYGANVNCHREKDGYTPLHKTACDLGFYTCQTVIFNNHIHFLINNGANVNSVNLEGETPLHLLLRVSEKDLESDRMTSIIHLYLENGADLTIKNNHGKAPLCYILSSNNVSLIEMFTSFAIRHMVAGQTNYINYYNESPFKMEVDKTFYNHCLDEVKIMKESTVDSVSLYDVYHADDSTLLEYLEYSWDPSAITSNKYLNDNRLYSSLILNKIKRILKLKQRLKILNSGEKLVDHISTVFNIRKGSLKHCFGLILKYLNYSDFKNINACFESETQNVYPLKQPI